MKYVAARSTVKHLIFILDLTPGFNGVGKDNYKTRQETFKFWNSVLFIPEVWR